MLVVPLYVIHVAVFLRNCYGWNSPNWLPSPTAGGQRPEMWQEPLEMSGFLQAQTRTSRPQRCAMDFRRSMISRRMEPEAHAPGCPPHGWPAARRQRMGPTAS